MGACRVLVLLALLTIPGIASSGEDLLIVSDGASSFEIVRPDKALPVVQTAVRELVDFIGRSTGIKMAVVSTPTPGKAHFFVGSAAPTDGLKPEGFRLRVVGGDLQLLGDDSPGDPEQIRRNRPTRCGTLFGAYEFLERYVGVFFAWPDELGTIVPSRKEIRVPRSLDLVQSPDWATRTIINTPPASTGALFGRRLRLGASIESDYTHNWFRILPAEKYGAAHPEYFALVRGERRAAYYMKNHGGQVCTTNSDVIAIFAQAAIDWFSRNPADDVFPISPNDGKGFCECETCRALDPAQTELAPNLTDRMLTFYNAVAERVAMVHPTKRLGGFVYAQYQRAPTRVKPHPNLVLAHAPNSAHAQGAAWVREREDERAWTSFGVPVTKYDIYYYGDYGSMNLPAPVSTHLAEKLRSEHELGFRGGYFYAAPSWELLGAGHVLMARLMWDRSVDVGALEKRFTAALYGSAGPDVLEYYHLLESRLRKARLDGIERSEPIVARTLGWTGEDATSAAFTIAAYGPILEQASAILQRGRGRDLSLPEKERLGRLQDHQDHLCGTVRAMIAAGRLESQEQFRAEDLESFREAIDLRQAARSRIRIHSPSFAAKLDDDDVGRLALIGSKGALARLVRAPAATAGGRRIRSLLLGDFESLLPSDVKSTGGAQVALMSDRPYAGRQSLRVTVPPGGEASIGLDAEVTPGSLIRLSLAHRCSGVKPRYDHTRESPLVRIQAPGQKEALSGRLGVPALDDVKDWKRFYSVLQIPPGIARIRLTFSFLLSGDFDVDEITIEELP